YFVYVSHLRNTRISRMQCIGWCSRMVKKSGTPKMKIFANTVKLATSDPEGCEYYECPLHLHVNTVQSSLCFYDPAALGYIEYPLRFPGDELQRSGASCVRSLYVVFRQPVTSARTLSELYVPLGDYSLFVQGIAIFEASTPLYTAPQFGVLFQIE